LKRYNSSHPLIRPHTTKATLLSCQIIDRKIVKYFLVVPTPLIRPHTTKATLLSYQIIDRKIVKYFLVVPIPLIRPHTTKATLLSYQIIDRKIVKYFLVVPTPLIRPFFTVVEGATVHYFPFSLFLSEEFGDILILSQSNKP
jgi:hypothetical protein